MVSINDTDMYKKVILTIPDFVLQKDIPTIINFFHYYGIADVKNVSVFEHPEPESYVEDKQFYGYAIIEINKWYTNNVSKSFYENLIVGSAKIMYNDFEYWDVEFYEPRTQEEVNAITQNLEEKLHEPADDNEEYYSEEDYRKSEAQEAKERMESDVGEYVHDDEDDKEDHDDKENHDDKEDHDDKDDHDDKEDHDDGEDDEDDGEDEDDPNDEDYEFEETDEEEDYQYEYVIYNHRHHKMNTRSKTTRKENKSKLTSVNTENITLEDIIVKKNKNYVKRNKRKEFKNEWSRRLRQKFNV